MLGDADLEVAVELEAELAGAAAQRLVLGMGDELLEGVPVDAGLVGGGQLGGRECGVLIFTRRLPVCSTACAG